MFEIIVLSLVFFLCIWRLPKLLEDAVLVERVVAFAVIVIATLVIGSIVIYWPLATDVAFYALGVAAWYYIVVRFIEKWRGARIDQEWKELNT